MIYLAIYLYIAGMPVAIHLTDEITDNVKPKHRALVALFWPALLVVYLYAILAVALGRL